jgi:hypothetical protein
MPFDLAELEVAKLRQDAQPQLCGCTVQRCRTPSHDITSKTFLVASIATAFCALVAAGYLVSFKSSNAGATCGHHRIGQ